MNTGIEFFTPSKAKEMKKVRVFVRGEINKYGECSEKSLQNALKHGTNVKVTFTHYKISGKESVFLRTSDE